MYNFYLNCVSLVLSLILFVKEDNRGVCLLLVDCCVVCFGVVAGCEEGLYLFFFLASFIVATVTNRGLLVLRESTHRSATTFLREETGNFVELVGGKHFNWIIVYSRLYIQLCTRTTQSVTLSLVVIHSCKYHDISSLHNLPHHQNTKQQSTSNRKTPLLLSSTITYKGVN